jgi:hypothetical protein
MLNPKNQKDRLFISLLQNDNVVIAKDHRIQSSLVNLSNKIIELEEVSTRLNKKIHNY